MSKVRLPAVLRAGDWLMFRQLGAYTHSAGCSFNGMPRPATRHVCGDTEARRLRQAEARTWRLGVAD